MKQRKDYADQSHWYKYIFGRCKVVHFDWNALREKKRIKKVECAGFHKLMTSMPGMYSVMGMAIVFRRTKILVLCSCRPI